MPKRGAMPAAAALAGGCLASAAGGSEENQLRGLSLLVSVPGTDQLAKHRAARAGSAEGGQRQKVQGQMWAVWPAAAQPGHGEDRLQPHSRKPQRRAPVPGVQRAVLPARLAAAPGGSPAAPGPEQRKEGWDALGLPSCLGRVERRRNRCTVRLFLTVLRAGIAVPAGAVGRALKAVSI